MESKRPVDYLAFVRNANSFNKRLALGRSQRLPFIDQQTGIAQADCALWRSEYERTRADQVGEASRVGGRLYSYPARRWQKTRRGEYLLSSQSSELDQHQAAHLSAGGGHESVSYASDKHQHTKHHRLGCLGAATTALARVPPTFAARPLINHHHHQHPQQPPPRADSTGSHSFVDSDSRDQSSATSQSVDSPPQSRHKQLEEEEERQLCMSLAGRLSVELTPPREDNEDEMPPTASDGFRLRNGRIKPHTSALELESSSRTEKVTKFSKNKNVGQSLMKTKRNEKNSTNGQKTTLNNMNSTKIKRKHERERPPRANQMMKDQMKALAASAKSKPPAKPYVCLICDQSYKTRPGLSYHFIHAHDTNLPRHLPVKLNANTSPNRPETTSVNGAKLASAKLKESTRTVGSPSVQARAKMKKNILERFDGQKPKTTRARLSPERSVTTTRVLRNSSRPISQLEFVPGPEVNSNDTIEDESVQRSEPAGEEHAKDELQDDTNELECGTRAEEVVCGPVAEGTKTDTDQILDDDEQPRAEDDIEQQSAMDKNPEGGGPNETAETHEAVESSRQEEAKNSRTERQQQRQESVATSCDVVGEAETEKVDTNVKAAQTCKRQSPFCDFCLGTVDKNRRTRLPEELISCSSCGSSGHPSCLQFSDNIRRSVQLYNWQCIECKTCSTCNKADHEDQLLFCDDCDRSYHTYCLSPRLDTLPEGNWTCKLCLFNGAAQSPSEGIPSVDLKALVDSDAKALLELAS